MGCGEIKLNREKRRENFHQKKKEKRREKKVSLTFCILGF